MDLRTTCPDCESPLVLFVGLNALHQGGLTATCDRVRRNGGQREYDPCGFAVHLTKDQLIDAVLRAAEGQEDADACPCEDPTCDCLCTDEENPLRVCECPSAPANQPEPAPEPPPAPRKTYVVCGCGRDLCAHGECAQRECGGPCEHCRDERRAKARRAA